MSASKIAHKKLRFYQAQTDPQRQQRIELWEQSTWDFWSRKTWVRFMYAYADNAFNQEKGRVGRISSFRIGTRNLDLIPSADKPNSRGSGAVKRYYDVSRAGTSVTKGITSGGLPGKVTGNAAQPGQWRSFQPGTFSIMVEVWSFDKQQWVSKLDEFVSNDQTSG